MALAVNGGAMGGRTAGLVHVGGVLLTAMVAQQLADDITGRESTGTEEAAHASPEEASTDTGETTELPSYVTKTLLVLATEG